MRLVGTSIGGQLSLAGARRRSVRRRSRLNGPEIGGSVLLQSMKTHRFEAEAYFAWVAPRSEGNLG